MNLKKLKQDMEVVFNKIKEQSHEGNVPELDVVKKFVRLCGQLQANAPDEWAEEADDFLHLANQLYQSTKNNSIKDVVPLVDSLEDSMDFCHRTFRDK